MDTLLSDVSLDIDSMSLLFLYPSPAVLLGLSTLVCSGSLLYLCCFVAVLSYHQVVSMMTMRYWPGDFGNIVGWLLKVYIVICIFSKSFHNLIFTAILWRRKIGIMVIKRKKLNTDTFIEETGWRFFASEQGKKLFDEKIKAFLTLLSHIMATCGFWTVKMWLNLIEMHCKYKNTHAHTRFGRLSIKYWLHIEMEIFSIYWIK